MAGTAILILAAGASSRMRGGDKLMEKVAGAPLLTVVLRRALAVADLAGGPVLCALPGPDHPRAALLEGLEVIPVPVVEAAEGMAASIRAGVAALPAGVAAVMILPADLPDLEAEDLRRMLAARADAPEGAILRAVDAAGRPGHPVLFPADLFDELARCQGDSGARAVLQAHPGRLLTVPLPEAHATTDLDTPEDWAAWRAARGE